MFYSLTLALIQLIITLTSSPSPSFSDPWSSTSEILDLSSIPYLCTHSKFMSFVLNIWLNHIEYYLQAVTHQGWNFFHNHLGDHEHHTMQYNACLQYIVHSVHLLKPRGSCNNIPLSFHNPKWLFYHFPFSITFNIKCPCTSPARIL